MAALVASAGAASAAPPPKVVSDYGQQLIAVSIAGVSRTKLQREGYELIRGAVGAVRTGAAQTTVHVATKRSGRRTVVIKHPRGLELPWQKGMEIEVEIGERRSGFTPTFHPYAAVRSNGRTLLNVNADKLYDSDPVITRGAVAGGPVGAMQRHAAAVRIGADAVVVPPGKWMRIPTAAGDWLVFQIIESIRPGAAPPRAGSGLTARHDVCYVWLARATPAR